MAKIGCGVISKNELPPFGAECKSTGIGGMGGSPMTGIECRWEERQSPSKEGGDA